MEKEHTLTALWQIEIFSNLGLILPNIVERVGKLHLGRISKEFQKLHIEVARGTPFDQALRSMVKKNKNNFVGQIGGKILYSYTTGAPLGPAIKELRSQYIKEKEQELVLFNKDLPGYLKLYFKVLISLFFLALGSFFFLNINSLRKLLNLQSNEIIEIFRMFMLCILFINLLILVYIRHKTPEVT